MTRADRHRLLDMRKAVDDLTAIVERGRAAWDDDKFAGLAAQKLLEILDEGAKQVDDDVRARASQLPSARQARGEIDPDAREEA